MRGWAVGLLVLFGAGSSQGAELVLRARSQPQGPVVTLGDLAELVTADRQEREALAGLELFPAPPPGQQRTLSVRELQELLAARPINLAEHRLSGSSRIIVEGFGQPAHAAPQSPVSAPMRTRAQRLVAEAIEQLLAAQAGPEQSWNVEVALSDAQIRALPADPRKIVARGGQPPWVGSQQFEIVAETPEGPARLVVEAEVSLRQPVVVAAVSLARGAVIRSADVRLAPAPPGSDASDAARSIEEVVDRETTRAIAAGTVLRTGMLRAPVMVRRGEVITVYCRAPGIRVRTVGRAREEGTLGDLILVESVLDRGVYAARVSGIQEAEVFARAVRAVGPEHDTASRGGTSLR